MENIWGVFSRYIVEPGVTYTEKESSCWHSRLKATNLMIGKKSLVCYNRLIARRLIPSVERKVIKELS